MKNLAVNCLVVGVILCLIWAFGCSNQSRPTSPVSQEQVLSGNPLAKPGQDPNSIMAKHLHVMGGSNHKCSDCHTKDGRADPPVALKGRYVNMGGPNHECTDCHNGVKAPMLPLPPGYTSCSDCHN